MNKLYGPIDGNLITVNFFPSYIGKEEDINYGECMEWAYIAYKLYRNVQLISNHGHAYVKQGRICYDSESPHGVLSQNDLKCNQRTYTYGGVRQTQIEFKKFWKQVDWEALDIRVRNFSRQKGKRKCV